MLKQFVPGRLTSPDTFTLSQSNPSNQTEQQQQPDNIFYCLKLEHQNVPLVLIRSITPLETETVTLAGPRPHLQYDILALAA